MQRIANPSTSVRFRLAPPNISYGLERGRPTAGQAGDRRRGHCRESGPRWSLPRGLRSTRLSNRAACGPWRSEEIIPESDSANTSLRCLRTWSEHGTNTTRRGVKYRYKGMTGYDPKRTFAYSSGEQSHRCNCRGASVNGTDAPRAAYSFGRYPASMDCRAELQRLATRWTRNAARNNRMQVSRSDTNA